MTVPKKRRTKSSIGNRRSHHSLDAIKLIKCSHCGSPIEPHKACAKCGYYKGREVISIKEKKTKKSAS